MAHRLIKTTPVRVLLGLLWTAVLVLAAWTTDRLFFPPVTHKGWTHAATLEAIPPEAGSLVYPAYLPRFLTWPPQRMFFRTLPVSGWWWGLATEGQTEPELWIGTGEGPYLPAMAPLSQCLEGAKRCPHGWYVLSAQLKGQLIYVIARIEKLEAARILRGLELDAGPLSSSGR